MQWILILSVISAFSFPVRSLLSDKRPQHFFLVPNGPEFFLNCLYRASRGERESACTRKSFSVFSTMHQRIRGCHHRVKNIHSVQPVSHSAREHRQGVSVHCYVWKKKVEFFLHFSSLAAKTLYSLSIHIQSSYSSLIITSATSFFII